MFSGQLGLLFMQRVDLIAVSIGLGDLCQIQQPEQACENNEHNGVTDGTEASFFGLKCGGVLVASGKPLPADGQRAGICHSLKLFLCLFFGAWVVRLFDERPRLFSCYLYNADVYFVGP